MTTRCAGPAGGCTRLRRSKRSRWRATSVQLGEVRSAASRVCPCSRSALVSHRRAGRPLSGRSSSQGLGVDAVRDSRHAGSARTRRCCWHRDEPPYGRRRDMIHDVKIDLTLPGEKLLVRLWETVAQKGVSALLRPWQLRREGRALADVRREDSLSLAQTELDVEHIRSGRKRFDASRQLVELHEQASPLAVMHRNRDAREIRGEVTSVRLS